ncbi:MAG: site-specific DNA-methyltransferase [Gracilimonas sp.]|uniref:hypothetical protein n=1 Tax=Gracilimonas sp. TaxID=1974203 RepID=UPI00374FE3EA|nr:site-specific DNA-methyltransferase [Gracilimonas sp.]
MTEVSVDNNSLSGGFNPYELNWDETVSFPSTRSLMEYGNKIYNRYPARSIFLVPRAIFYQNHLKNKKLNILDPYMGSGTTAVEASQFKFNIFGVEMDPFARLISEVSIMRFNDIEKNELRKLLEKIKKNWKNHTINDDLYPDLKNVEYWFDDKIFKDLLRLKSYIYDTITNENYLKFFKVTFADCIKPTSKMERQSTKPYISSKYEKKIKPVIESFEYSFKKHLKALSQYEVDNEYNPKINWIGNDASSFQSEETIDVAITSPPYLNAFDYTQIIKVASSWVGTLTNPDIKELRSIQVGHHYRREVKFHNEAINAFKTFYDKLLSLDKDKTRSSPQKLADTCLAYFNDIYSNLENVYRSLKKGGEYHMILGDNTIKGIEIPTHKLIANLAQKTGFDWFGYYKYPIKDHRTSIPRNGKGGKIKYEYIISLRK